MAKEQKIEVEGKVLEALANMKFRVHLPLMGDAPIICYLGGRIQKNNIRIVPGDTVLVDFSPYDLTIGRIIRRK